MSIIRYCKSCTVFGAALLIFLSYSPLTTQYANATWKGWCGGTTEYCEARTIAKTAVGCTIDAPDRKTPYMVGSHQNYYYDCWIPEVLMPTPCLEGEWDNSANGGLGGCVTPITEDCSARPVIMSDAGKGAGYSYQGCNYRQCGSFVDADNGHYNNFYCADPVVCVDTISGCLPEETSPQTSDLDDGCALIGGQTICIDDTNPNSCYEVNGKQECFPENTICGVKNGTYQCLDIGSNNCGQFNGETLCFTQNDSDGDGEQTPEVVDPDSPDHPNNGGNGDGDCTNDPTDCRTEGEGGNPNNQPGDRGTEADRLTAQAIADELIKKGLWQKQPGSIQSVEDVKKLAQELPADLEEQAQGIIDDVLNGSGAFTHKSDVEGVADVVTGVIPGSGSCAPVTLPTTMGTSYQITCDDFSRARDFLSFVFYALTVYAIFMIVVDTRKESR